MKKNRNWTEILCLFLVSLLILVLIMGCDLMPPNTTESNVILDKQEFNRREELAILKAKPSHTVDVDTLQNMANNILQIRTDARSIGKEKSVVITGVSKLPLLTDKRFTNSFGNGRALSVNEEEPVELYCFSTENIEEENSGFILMSNDYRIGYVLAIVDNGDFTNTENPFINILNIALTEYIDETIAIYSEITEEETLLAIEKLHHVEPDARTLTSFWHGDDWVATGKVETDFKKADASFPVIKTKWGQNAPYNKYVKYYQDQNNKLGVQNYVAGCGPVAAAQLIAYYGHISNTNKPSTFTIGSGSSIARWDGTYNFNDLTAQPKINATGTLNEELRGQVAALMHHIGLTLKSTYSNNNTNSTNSNITSSFRNTFGYKSDNSYFISATSFSQTATTWTVTVHNNSRSWVINQLNAKPKARPVIIRGDRIDGNEKVGHYWLIDGHGTMTYYKEYLNKKGSSVLYSSTLTLTNNTVMVHCNFGWSGDGDGWYIYGLFDTGNMAVLDDYSGINNAKRFYSSNVQVFVPYR